MDRERIINLAAQIVHLRDKVKHGWAEVARCESSLHSAKHAVNEAREALSVAVGEISGGGRERNAEHPPERVIAADRRRRLRRLRDQVGMDSITEYLYRSPVYATLGRELGMGTQDTHVPKSGKEYKWGWLTVEEHVTILALANERYPKGDE